MTDRPSLHLYKLLGKLPVPVTDPVEWGLWYQKAERHVAKDVVDGFVISTVFLAIDPSFGRSEPLLFETMVFDKQGESTACERCSTWDQALEQHATMVDQVRSEREAT